MADNRDTSYLSDGLGGKVEGKGMQNDECRMQNQSRNAADILDVLELPAAEHAVAGD